MDFYNVPAGCLSVLVYCLWISTSKGVPVLTSFPDPPIDGKPFTFTCTENGGLDPNLVVWYRNGTDKNVRPTSKTIIFGNVVKDLNVTVSSNQFNLTFFFLISQEQNVPWRCTHNGVSSNTVTVTTATQNIPATATAAATTDLSPIYTLAGIAAAAILVTIFIIIIAACRDRRKDQGQRIRRSSMNTTSSDRRSIEMVTHDMYRPYLGHRVTPSTRGWHNNFVDMVDNDMYRSYLGHRATPTTRVWQDNFVDVYSQVIKPRYNDRQYSLGRMGRF
ncbi:uncharacterized protein LOC124292427 isoform X2 [Haliotis rubra]|uniref:uncharacterized protein LOC124292427 isoform X2 n=1 Tax=Haliotis rubra TaxID=36100 RepID=UPI001EE55B89|nr:uncharacterized protein LOC124292427 isoform X2 [Haliotis rubra]